MSIPKLKVHTCCHPHTQGSLASERDKAQHLNKQNVRATSARMDLDLDLDFNFRPAPPRTVLGRAHDGGEQ